MRTDDVPDNLCATCGRTAVKASRHCESCWEKIEVDELEARFEDAEERAFEAKRDEERR